MLYVKRKVFEPIDIMSKENTLPALSVILNGSEGSYATVVKTLPSAMNKEYL